MRFLRSWVLVALIPAISVGCYRLKETPAKSQLDIEYSEKAPGEPQEAMETDTRSAEGTAGLTSSTKSNNRKFSEFSKVTKIVVVHGSHEMRTIEDGQQISKIIRFANRYLEGWETPWYGIPVPMWTVDVYSGGTFLGHFGFGKGFFETHREGGFFTRSASETEIQQFASLIGAPVAKADSFLGSKAGDERSVVSIKLCWCPPGKFTMGSPRDESERRPDEDQVEVTLTKGFWTAKNEATQGQWKRVMGKLPGELTAELPEGDDYPVGNVNFAECEAFCRKLTELGRKSGELPKDWEFRLPTEAQWEYACRAGTKTATAFGDKLSSKQANFKGKPYNGGEPGPSLGRADKVGCYPPNAWGLHDMHGNIFEWCRDWYHAKLPGGVDPDLYSAKRTAEKNRTGDYSRVRRGGAWTDDGWPCRSACRLRFEPERRYDHIGFRVVAVQP